MPAVVQTNRLDYARASLRIPLEKSIVISYSLFIATKAYITWNGMMSRCFRPDSASFYRYGGRGITVCDRWKTFTNFLSDMGEPDVGMCIDRINNNGHYEPGNCRWTTPTRNNRNRSDNFIVTVREQTGCLKDVVEFFGADYRLVYNRLRRGWFEEDAFFAPKSRTGSTRNSPLKWKPVKIMRDSGYAIRWQEKQRENGKCWKCGKPANGFKLCKKHRKMDLARKKKKVVA